MPKVYNKRNNDAPADAVYVGRPTKWGNPFKIDKRMCSISREDREKVVEEYRNWVKKDPVLIEIIKTELKGKDLVCWCAPEPCHADVLLEIANE